MEKVTKLHPDKVTTVERLEKLIEKVQRDPETHHSLIVLTMSKDGSEFDWALAGGPNLIQALGVIELLKIELMNLAIGVGHAD